jgi:nitroreductase
MEVFEAVRTALAVREFQGKPVPPDAARRIVEAAWLSPSDANRSPSTSSPSTTGRFATIAPAQRNTRI